MALFQNISFNNLISRYCNQKKNKKPNGSLYSSWHGYMCRKMQQTLGVTRLDAFHQILGGISWQTKRVDELKWWELHFSHFAKADLKVVVSRLSGFEVNSRWESKNLLPWKGVFNWLGRFSMQTAACAGWMRVLKRKARCSWHDMYSRLSTSLSAGAKCSVTMLLCWVSGAHTPLPQTLYIKRNNSQPLLVPRYVDIFNWKPVKWLKITLPKLLSWLQWWKKLNLFGTAHSIYREYVHQNRKYLYRKKKALVL